MIQNDNDNDNESTGPSMPTNCALPRGTVDHCEFICLDALISKRTVHGTTEKDSGSWETCNKHSSGSLLWQGRPASYLPLSPSHSYVSVAPILLFLLFVILPASGKSERIIFIDPRDCDDSQEGHNKSPYRGDLQRNVNSLNLPEDGVPPPNLSTSADEAPTLGNTNINININVESSSNVAIGINANSNGGNNGQST